MGSQGFWLWKQSANGIQSQSMLREDELQRLTNGFRVLDILEVTIVVALFIVKQEQAMESCFEATPGSGFGTGGLARFASNVVTNGL